MLPELCYQMLLQRKYTFYHQNHRVRILNTLLDAFRTNSRKIGSNHSMVIPMLANQDMTRMLVYCQLHNYEVVPGVISRELRGWSPLVKIAVNFWGTQPLKIPALALLFKVY